MVVPSCKVRSAIALFVAFEVENQLYNRANTVRCRVVGENVRRVDPRNFADLQELSVCRLSYPNRIDNRAIDNLLQLLMSLQPSY